MATITATACSSNVSPAKIARRSARYVPEQWSVAPGTEIERIVGYWDMQDGPRDTPNGEDRTIAQLIAALRDPDARVRASAAYDLADVAFNPVQADVARAVDALLPLLADPVGDVRANAAYALSHLADARDAPAAEALLPLLDDSDPVVRMHAAQAIGRLAYPPALEPLLGLLQDDDAGVREYAAQYGFCILGEVAFQPLLSALADARGDVRAGAAVALGSLVSRDALWAVPERMMGRYPYALSDAGKARVVDALIAATEDEDGLVRYRAIGALGWQGDPRAAPVLVQALADADPDVRVAAVDGLHQCGVRTAAPLLVRMLADASLAVRLHTVTALGDLGDEQALIALQAAQRQDVDAGVREAAGWTIARLQDDRS